MSHDSTKPNVSFEVIWIRLRGWIRLVLNLGLIGLMLYGFYLMALGRSATSAGILGYKFVPQTVGELVIHPDMQIVGVGAFLVTGAIGAFMKLNYIRGNPQSAWL